MKCRAKGGDGVGGESRLYHQSEAKSGIASDPCFVQRPSECSAPFLSAPDERTHAGILQTECKLQRGPVLSGDADGATVAAWNPSALTMWKTCLKHGARMGQPVEARR